MTDDQLDGHPGDPARVAVGVLRAVTDAVCDLAEAMFGVTPEEGAR